MAILDYQALMLPVLREAAIGETRVHAAATSSFSAPAGKYVCHIPQRVILIDGGRLAALLVSTTSAFGSVARLR